MKKSYLFSILAMAITSFLILLFSSVQAIEVNGVPEGCTSITVGRLASVDGSVMTSHTADSREHRTWLDIQPTRHHKKGEMENIYKNTEFTPSAYDLSKREVVGKIDGTEVTYGYINTFLPPMNVHQLAVGESTFGGKKEMRSE
jgi:dipeptidase